MTAEIAILNKTAVALAADSAVTITAGSKEDKIFDSADKLFELCDRNPVGIMIYNGMSFMEAPLPSLIRDFRCKNRGSSKFVGDIADNFLGFLNKSGLQAPSSVKERSIIAIISPVFLIIRDEIFKAFQKRVMNSTEDAGDPKALIERIFTTVTARYLRFFKRAGDANFVGKDRIQFSQAEESLL